MRRTLIGLALLATVSLGATFLLPTPPPTVEPERSKRKINRRLPDISEFKPKTVAAQPSKAITEPPFKSAAEGSKTLGEEMLVLGVNFNGVAKAYPISMLCGPSREIINDTFGDHPLAATW